MEKDGKKCHIIKMEHHKRLGHAFYEVLLGHLSPELAEEEIEVSALMRKAVKEGKDPAEDKTLIQRWRDLQFNPDYIQASEKATAEIYGDCLADVLNIPEEDGPKEI